MYQLRQQYHECDVLDYCDVMKKQRNGESSLVGVLGDMISDTEGLRRAYEDNNSVYTAGDTLYVAGTKSASDWLHNVKIPLGMTKRTPRYEQASRQLKAMPQVRRVIGHSLGGAVALELGAERPDLKTRTYGAPVFSASGGERYKEAGDPVSALDFGAKMSLPGGWNPHSYARLGKEKVHDVTSEGVTEDSFTVNGVEHAYR